MADGELEWEIEKIIGHHILKSKGKTQVEFQVKWKGDFDVTWHLFQDFHHSLDTIEEYLGLCTAAERNKICEGLTPEELSLLKQSFTDQPKKKRKIG